MPVVSRLRVVSLPAFCNNMKNRSICIWVNVSPSTSAVRSTLRRSSCGSARRCSHSESAYMNIAVAASARSSDVTDSSKPNVSSVQRNTCSRSPSGTPTRSAMTWSGNHSAMSVTRSQLSVSPSASTIRSHANANPIFELCDATRREAFVDDLAQLGVQRRVLADEQIRHPAVAVLGHFGVEERDAARSRTSRNRARRAGRRRARAITQ